LFGVKILGKVGAPMRLISALLGVVFVILGLAGPSLFPTITGLSGGTTPPAPGPGGNPIIVTINAPPGVPPDQWAEIEVVATNNVGQPIPDAVVNLQAGGGFFENSGNPGTEGPTGPGGHFVVRWKCQACAPSYVLAVKVMKPGFDDWKGEVRINIP
jgi:hypothetical protein